MLPSSSQRTPAMRILGYVDKILTFKIGYILQCELMFILNPGKFNWISPCSHLLSFPYPLVEKGLTNILDIYSFLY